MSIQSVKRNGIAYDLTLSDGSTTSGVLDDHYLYPEIQEWVTAGGVIEPEFTPAELAEEDESKRVSDITDKADSHIETVVSKDKQIKLLTRGLVLNNKIATGATLTTDETAEVDLLLNIDAWITSVRTIENSAIANGDAVDTVIYPKYGV